VTSVRGVTLSPMIESDASFVLAIRNDQSTYPMLHDTRRFSAPEFVEWFRSRSPRWLTISDSNAGEKVGYIRTLWVDSDQTELQIGIDIHPAHRRLGYARAAYAALFERLTFKMVGTVCLEVLDHNFAARALYDELGFRETGRRRFRNGEGSKWSVEMRRPLVHLTGRHCRVIACWFGDRRAWHAVSGPTESRSMFRFLLQKERELDKGLHCDTILVINTPMGDEVRRDSRYREVRSLVRHSDGARTPNGVIRVFERQNIGLSFGAFDYAFNRFAGMYDYWHFLEDDHIVVADGQLRSDYFQFKDVGEDLGFIASVGCSDVMARHAHGGCGVTTRTVLQAQRQKNFSPELGRHHLPFWNSGRDGAEDHNWHGEVPFTSGIAADGFKLVDSRVDKFLVNWRSPELRNCHGEAVRFVPWSEEMVLDEPSS